MNWAPPLWRKEIEEGLRGILIKKQREIERITAKTQLILKSKISIDYQHLHQMKQN